MKTNPDMLPVATAAMSGSSPRRRPSLGAALVVGLLLATPAAAAGEEGLWEVRIGSDLVLDDTGRLADEAQPVRVSVGAGLYATDHLVLGARARLGVGSAGEGGGQEDSRWEALAIGTGLWSVAAVELVGTVGLGYYSEELGGSDWTFDDRGPILAVEGGLRLPLHRRIRPELVASYTLSHSQHHERNTSYPEWTHAVMAGLAFAFTL